MPAGGDGRVKHRSPGSPGSPGLRPGSERNGGASVEPARGGAAGGAWGWRLRVTPPPGGAWTRKGVGAGPGGARRGLGRLGSRGELATTASTASTNSRASRLSHANMEKIPISCGCSLQRECGAAALPSITDSPLHRRLAVRGPRVGLAGPTGQRGSVAARRGQPGDPAAAPPRGRGDDNAARRRGDAH